MWIDTLADTGTRYYIMYEMDVSRLVFTSVFFH